jgi:predicted CoA-substrate-specific enzyme activase
MLVKESVGFCIGASSVSQVRLIESFNKPAILSSRSIPHHGDPKSVIHELFNNGTPENAVVTGRKFRKLLNITSITEPEAVELALEYLNLKADVVVSIGGENFIVYQLDGRGKISKCITGNKCASGTGEFFIQQIKRMDLNINEAIELSDNSHPYNISGRCSVFCKSDCTHALNKGVSKGYVVAGLSRMVAQKVIELTSILNPQNVILIGGVTRNDVVVGYLKEHFKNVIVPDQASCFEALGAACYAFQNNVSPIKNSDLFKENHTTFTYFDDLKKYISKVHFKNFQKSAASDGDECILGLDVGSTTTKAILMKVNDNSIIASEYLRTKGDPIAASIECYKSLRDQLNFKLNITGLGVTGSGRHISGLHAQTDGIVNEIIAHANATVYFDSEADTIFEIGGQDAKYTYITAGVPSDYAMNEACSAGTGSFLEEAAMESLNINYTQIGDLALEADSPPNFNDQCSAFISSDIKNALHEGLSKENILAGLVYSICLNYTNRVKGNRPVGKKIFMQGGVCYNKAVPAAMAALTGKEIIVPPEPGLMGAFGAALEIKKRVELNLIAKSDFSLEELIDRKVEYGKDFICAGGAEKCDRKCSISIISINGHKFPFGGACNKYYDRKSYTSKNIKEKNFVSLRQQLVFEKYIYSKELHPAAKTIGIPKSFLTNTYYPLYYNFFTQLGFKVILADEPLKSGIEKQQAAFCFPVELAHGFFEDLLDKKPDYIFLPHIQELYDSASDFYSKTCVLLQSENYYLRTTFKNYLNGTKILTPILNFSNGYESAKVQFVELASSLNKSKGDASAAFDFALSKLNEMLEEFKSLGKNILSKLESNPEEFAVVLFGRSYSAFAKEANLGIPQKFASRNVTIIPHDFLPSEHFENFDHMYWSAGQQILRSAKFVKEHKQLFAAYITNFSCGPDSFIITYFRNIMGNKPSLTLELDSHSADAGINTRIEAALDIIVRYRELSKLGLIAEKKKEFIPLRIKDAYTIIDSDNKELSITDTSVKMFIPSMGRYAAEAFAAAFKNIGVNAEALPVYDYKTLGLGRGNTTCKECLPLILCSGAMLNACEKRKSADERFLFFMATSAGPCRLGQYQIFLKELIKKKELRNVGVYTLSDEDSYEGLDNEFIKRGWTAITLGDVFQNMNLALQVLAADKEKSLEILNVEWGRIAEKLEHSSLEDVFRQVEKSAETLKQIKKRITYDEAVKVVLTGEIFVRNDEFSRGELINRLIENNVLVKVAPIGEYVFYSGYLMKNDTDRKPLDLSQRLRLYLKEHAQRKIEKRIKKCFAQTGLIEYELIDIEEVVGKAEHLINPQLHGEAILTVGLALKEIIDHTAGVISLGPFSCMPSRVAESILNCEMNIEGKATADKKIIRSYPDKIDNLPFLAIETDGNIFPQIIQSKIEIFILQAQRLHKKLSKASISEREKYKDALRDKLVELYEDKIHPQPEEGYAEQSDVAPEIKY